MGRWPGRIVLGLLAGAVLWPGLARAEIAVGAVLSLTGPAASLGIPERNTIELLPRTMAGEAVRWVVLDDASDPAAAVRAARKLVEEERVDVILGPSNTPNSLAVLDTAAASGTPVVSLSGSNAVIEPQEGARRWAFKMLPSERVAATQILDHMLRHSARSIASIGFATSLGDGYISALETAAAERGIKTPLQVRYNPADAGVAPQVLRLLATRPDAVFVAASSTPATTPILELRARGFTGPIYTVQGIAGPDALRVGGKALDGVMFSSVPVLVAEQLPDEHPVKAQALRFVAAYEAKHGPGSRNLFGATLWTPTCSSPPGRRWRPRGHNPAPPSSAAPCATPWSGCGAWWARRACSTSRPPTTAAPKRRAR